MKGSFTKYFVSINTRNLAILSDYAYIVDDVCSISINRGWMDLKSRENKI